ncbi:hypothetical protein ACQKJZ_10615, partial [Sphingomonas sp. NPDC019816]|uniref:hypothetical protein n=1 Tax=Sphingomonas sp. NPDC019816 TaxID=3390679 RepID=UPI003CFDC5F7
MTYTPTSAFRIAILREVGATAIVLHAGTRDSSYWTCPGKVESSLEVKGELDDEAATFHEGIRGG